MSKISAVRTDGPLWAVKQCADYLGVPEMWYRRNILTLDNHPSPYDPRKKRWAFWTDQMKSYLDDTSNLVHR